MKPIAAADLAHERGTLRLAQRQEESERFFGEQAGRIASLCHRAAERFARGGRLLAIGSSPAARSDVRHVAVEFVHPVIVGKRALPALGLCDEAAALGEAVALLVEPDDILIAFGEADGAEGRGLARAVDAARARGALALAFAPLGAEWELRPAGEDPLLRQELVEVLYHVVWELVHVFFDHRGLLDGRDAAPVHDAGASSFLYPFLAEEQVDLDSVLRDVEASVLMKARETIALAAETVQEGFEELRASAVLLRRAFAQGGRVLALGNGGSATDATDLVADLTHPPHGWTPRPALDLTADPAILTAIANDIGVEEIFARQVIAYGRPEDVLVAFSTSGNSLSVAQALAEARRRGMGTIAFVGYDGGRVVAEGLADHAIVTRSQHIPRIQEAQATAWHVLRELVEI
jgi:D-sedoheptulose 7-phosphate isomerase